MRHFVQDEYTTLSVQGSVSAKESHRIQGLGKRGGPLVTREQAGAMESFLARPPAPSEECVPVRSDSFLPADSWSLVLLSCPLRGQALRPGYTYSGSLFQEWSLHFGAELQP